MGRADAPQSWNRYAYVRNNPILLVDPKGLYVCRGQDNQCNTLKLALLRLKFDAARMSIADGRNQALKIVEAYGKFGDQTSKINTVWIDPPKGDANGRALVGPDGKQVPLLGPGIIGQAGAKGNMFISFQNLKIKSGGNNDLAFAMLEGNLIHEGVHELQAGVDPPSHARHVLFPNEVAAYTLQNALYRAMGFERLTVDPTVGAQHSVDAACAPGCKP
jgi:hypothetical protein